MRRRNISIWLGFLVGLAAVAGYFPLVDQWPSLADWITLVLFGAGLAIIARGLTCAFLEPGIYRGKIAGSILMILTLALAGLFVLNAFYIARLVPPSSGAPQVGGRAPDFTLLDADGREVSLADLLGASDRGPVNGALLIFYRGHW